MGTPTKKRKLNTDSKASPSASRSLDYFFGKQRENPTIQPSNKAEQRNEESNKSTALTDEELARKLQAKWNQEAAAETDTQKGPTNNKADHNIPSFQPQSLGGGATGELNGDGGEAAIFGKSTPYIGIRSPEPKAKNTLSLQSAGSAEDIITSNIPFDESPLTFEPSKYVNDLQNLWTAEGGNATYALLTRCFVLVNSTQSRIKIVDTLVNLLRVIIEGDPSSLLPTVRTNKSPLQHRYKHYFCIVPFYSYAGICRSTLDLDCNLT
jgi:DNA ligase 1